MTDRSSEKDAAEDQDQDQDRPDINVGLAYWDSIAQRDISNNAVLGGYGNGSLPRIDAMGSRLFLLTIRPDLSTIDAPYKTNGSPRITEDSEKKRERRIYRALDVGAGIGRVTSDVLLYLFDRIDLLEPVTGFIETAKRNALNGKWTQLNRHDSRHEYDDGKKKKGVRFWKKPIQSFDPLQAIVNQSSLISAPIQISDQTSIVGAQDSWNDSNGYDIIWAQWTLGHLSDEELVDFLKKCKKALRPANPIESLNNQELGVKSFERNGGLIIVKENIYVHPTDPDSDCFLFDKEDSSLTRSHASFLRIFKSAGLNLIQQDVQNGFDPDLFKVNFYALQ